jgi:hypothetical protein
MQESEAGQYYYGNSMAFKFAIEVLEVRPIICKVIKRRLDYQK